MSEMEKKAEQMTDEDLGAIAGGVSANYLAAQDVMAGKYGNGEERRRRLIAAGYNYDAVQHLVNGLVKGYDRVARDVIAGGAPDNYTLICAFVAKG